ncbi:hypothetical protein [Pseudonocardia xishanensis]|uniref:Uncharacterized protein n=1 Tax=Pseudonocardia xishanensis TaxID=630995 RepID=A0ABP8RMV0_9PSEU
MDEILEAPLMNPVALAVVGGVLLVAVLVTGLVLRRMWTRARTFAGSQQHRIERARTELAALRLDGPRREAVDLRRRLAESVTATDRQLAAAPSVLVSATVEDQHRELRRLATELDAHLRTLQDEPDAARVEAALPEATGWTDQLCEIAAELRAAVRESARATTHTDVRALDTGTKDGVAALRAGIDFLSERVRRS